MKKWHDIILQKHAENEQLYELPYVEPFASANAFTASLTLTRHCLQLCQFIWEKHRQDE